MRAELKYIRHLYPVCHNAKIIVSIRKRNKKRERNHYDLRTKKGTKLIVKNKNTKKKEVKNNKRKSIAIN